MFKEYKTVGDFIVGCGDFCVENGLTSLNTVGLQTRAFIKSMKTIVDFFYHITMTVSLVVNGDSYKV